MHINKHGLSRNIPSEIKRKIRQECGFGCVVCGGAIYEYEHIEPEFADAVIHEVSKIALLCGSCHLNVTKGLWSKEKIAEHRKNPFSLKHGNSRYSMDISIRNKFQISLGKCTFIDTTNLIEIDNKVILKILPPEVKNTAPRVIANFFDQYGNEIASIHKNEWIGNITAFDIEFIGNEISVRSKKYQIDLKIKISHPNIININKINLKYNSCRIYGDTEKGFILKSKSTEISFGKVERVFRKANYGMLIKGGDIFLSETKLFELKIKNKTSVETKLGYIKAVGDIAVEIKEKGDPSGQFNCKSTGPNKNSYVEIQIPLNDSRRYTMNLNNTLNKNSLCLCGSNLRYEKCCRKNKGIINSILKTKIISHCITDVIGRHEIKNIIFDIKHVKNEIPTKLFVSDKNELVLIFNSANLPNLNRVGFSLILFDCIKNNFHYYLHNIYQDARQGVLTGINEVLISIPIYDRLKRRGFEVTNAFEKDFQWIMDFIKNPPVTENYMTLNNLNYALHLIRLSYDCEIISKEKQKEVFGFYESYFPLAYGIFKDILSIVLTHNIYQFEEFNQCKLRILQYMNGIFRNGFDEAIKHIETHILKINVDKEKFNGIEINKPKN